MRAEELFESFGNLEEDLLDRSSRTGGNAGAGKAMHAGRRYAGIAACLAVFLAAGVTGKVLTGNRGSAPRIEEGAKVRDGQDTGPVGDAMATDKQDHPAAETQGSADAATTTTTTTTAVAEELAGSMVQVGDYSAIYERVSSDSALAERLGDPVEGMVNWYRLSGHEDWQYLIHTGKEYTLWRFDSLGADSYAYREVLENIYRMASPEDLVEIIVEPIRADNTEEGLAIQKEIGTLSVTDREKLEAFYNILSGLTCYGNEMRDIVLEDAQSSSMREEMWDSRSLTLVTSGGLRIDTLKYTGVTGRFYEYGGCAYSTLTAEEKNQIEEILEIELFRESGGAQEELPDAPGVTVWEETGSVAWDVPVDEATYREARSYSAELTDLQNRVSQAMMNRELPFVAVSAIYENPDRLHVVVTTEDEELLAKLEAFDTTGRLMEIEYREDARITLE